MIIGVKLKTPRCWNNDQLCNELKKHMNATYYCCNENIDPHTEILVTNNITKTDISALSNLVYVICPTSGHEGIPYQALLDRGVVIFTNINNIAQCVSAYTEHHIFSSTEIKGLRNLNGKNITILGFGTIGNRIFDRLSVYGGNYTIIRKNINKKRFSSFYKEVRLSDAPISLSYSDIIINTLPLNEETTNALTMDLFFRSSAIFVGLSRAGIFNEAQIAKKVFEGMLSMAILDVYPPNLDIYQGIHPRLILTEHTAGIWGKGIYHLTDFVMEKIKYLKDRGGHVN